MKSVLLCIKPKRCKDIESGHITMEICKTRPNIDVPFKCYIYCTKPSKKHQTICGSMALNDDELYRHPTGGMKYGNSIELMLCDEDEYSKDNFLNGKVIGEFICDNIEEFQVFDDKTVQYWNRYHLENSGMTYNEIANIPTKSSALYAWSILSPKFYDKPKALNDFTKCSDKDKRPCQLGKKCQYAEFDYSENCTYCTNDFDGEGCPFLRLTRPPRGWCYVEELEDLEQKSPQDIVFRGKRKDTNDWIEGSLVTLDSRYFILNDAISSLSGEYTQWSTDNIGNGTFHSISGAVEVIPQTVGRCTNQRDKNNAVI